MACMEHHCTNCSFSAFNNLPRDPETCPECGSEMQHLFDEDPEDDFDFDEDEYEEDSSEDDYD